MLLNKIRSAVTSKPKPDLRPTFVPTTGSEEELLEAAYVAALIDPTALGKAVREAAASQLLANGNLASLTPENEVRLAQRVQERHRFVREGELARIEKWIGLFGGMIHNGLRRTIRQVEARGGFTIVVASEKYDLGVICFTQRPGRITLRH